MAIIFCDDFGGYGTTVSYMMDGLYSEVQLGTNLVDDPDPNVTKVVLRGFSNAVGGGRVRRVFPTGAHNTVGIAMRIWLEGLPPTNGAAPCFGFSDSGNTRQCWLSFTTTGQITILSANYATIATTTLPVVTANAWNHIEVKFTADTSGGGTDNGAAEVRVNGVTVLTATVLATGQNYAQFRIDCPNDVGTGNTFYVKDLILWDSTGSNNNDFFGTVSVISRTTDTDNAFNWTASTGSTGWNLLDNSPPVDGTDYISAGTPPPAASVFGLTSLPADVTSVRALVTQVRARKVDGGDGTLQVGIISNGDTGLGADRPLTTAFTYYEDIFPVDPDTSANWTVSAAEAATFRVNRTT